MSAGRTNFLGLFSRGGLPTTQLVLLTFSNFSGVMVFGNYVSGIMFQRCFPTTQLLFLSNFPISFPTYPHTELPSNSPSCQSLFSSPEDHTHHHLLSSWVWTVCRDCLQRRVEAVECHSHWQMPFSFSMKNLVINDWLRKHHNDLKPILWMIPEIQELASRIFRSVEIYDFSIKLSCEETRTQDFIFKMEKIS